MEEESIVKWEFHDSIPEDEKIRNMFINATHTGGGQEIQKLLYFMDIFFSFSHSSILNNCLVEVDGESPEKAVEIIEAVYRSSEKKISITFPIDK